VTAEAGAHARLAWRDAVIERIERQTPRVISVFLRVDLALHEAGQHLDVRLTAPDGYEAQRSYSIASPPGAPLVELAIEELAEGEVSTYFHEVAVVGDAIEVRGPIGGHFVWRAEDGGPVLLVGGGSGVVPLVAIARHRAIASPQTPALLLYSARTWDEVIFREELVFAQAQQPEFLFIATTTRAPKVRTTDFEGRLDAVQMRGALARWGRAPRLAYVCGANRFVEAAATALIEAGVEAERIRTERYGGA
jgi:ferredoxin-NADP reductase